ncbi:prepilin peptidase [Sandarakinorhabdus sp. DWP1-3-1]|uniref:prepilin peptidase n=1 Tax=Sandarakinorhabdus sp. DWP1-3-1 TaxID=2804627 RepID=UPI003CF92A98
MIAALLGLVAGLIIGSFIAALTWRWPQGRSIATGRSRCDHCDVVLAPRDLVPVISHLVLRGRCRHCRTPIARRHMAIEIAGAGVGALAMALHPDMAGVVGAAFGWLLLALVVLDMEQLWLPDALTLPLLVAGLVAGLWLQPAMPDRVIGAVAGFASLAVIAAGYKAATGRVGMGGGDPKLFGAIGAWLGWAALPLVLLLAALLGLALVARDRLAGRMVGRHSRVPLGALLAAAAWWLWLVSPALQWLP